MDLEDPMMEVVQTHIIPSEETIDADVVQVTKVKIGVTAKPFSQLFFYLKDFTMFFFLLKDF
jgi:hypothetical protein